MGPRETIGLMQRALTHITAAVLALCLTPAIALAITEHESQTAQDQSMNGPSLAASNTALSTQAEQYNLWVAGIRVTSENLVIDSTDDSTISGSATYSPDNNTLTLSDFTCDYKGIQADFVPPAAIYSGSSEYLTIVFTGTNTVRSSCAAATGLHQTVTTDTQTGAATGQVASNDKETTYSYAIYGEGPLAFSGTGSLSACGGQANYSIGIFSKSSLTFSGTGSLSACGGQANYSIGIYSKSSSAFDITSLNAVGGTADYSFGIYGINQGREGYGVCVKGGNVTATGGSGPSTFQSCGIVGSAPEGGDAVGILGGTVTATGGAVSIGTDPYSYGIWGNARSTGVGTLVSQNVTQVSAVGHGMALKGTLTNQIPGTGWSNEADSASIPVANKTEWPNLKKMTFVNAQTPAAQIGDQQYDTIDLALEKAESYAIIKLLRNVIVADEVLISKDVTLDLNGYGILQAGGRGNSVIILSDDKDINFTLTDTGVKAPHYLSLAGGRAVFVSDMGEESDTRIKVEGGFLAGGNGNSGVELGVGSTFTMTGGAIVGNQAATHGGGVFVCMDSSFKMTGGAITNNSSNNEKGVGGVFVQEKGTIAVSGNAVIEGNYKGASNSAQASNVYLERPEARIAVEGALESTASIGVTMAFPGLFTISSGGVKASDYLRCFSSDDDTYGVLMNGDELTLGAPHVHSFTYSASGATITATCSNTDGSCNLPNAQISLAVIAPTKKVYGDTGSASATFDTNQLASFNKETKFALTTKDIAYYHNSGMLNQAPTDAGVYVAKFAAGGVIAEANYEIAQRTATLEWGDTQFICNNKPLSPIATVSNMLPGDTCDVAITGARVKPGKYIATAASLSNHNYALPENVSIPFAIKLGTPLVTARAHTNTSAIGVRWNGVPGAQYYLLQYRVKGGKWKSAKVKAKSKTLTNMKAGKLYQIRVRAVAKKSKGSWATTVMRFYPKSQLWAKSRKEGTVTLRWTLMPQANAGYSVAVRYSKNGPIIARKIAKPGALGTTLSGLKSGKRIWLSVRALVSTNTGAKLTIKTFNPARLRVK